MSKSDRENVLFLQKRIQHVNGILVARFEIGHTRQKLPACGGNLLLHRIS
jgi:hypothetical protein